MFKRALLLQLTLLAVVFVCLGQPDSLSYTPLGPKGDIPKDMLIKSSKKYEVEKSTISKTETKKDRKSKESFYLSTNFEIDKLLLSGMVSFNDPITVYLNKIVDVLLKDEPALRKQVRVYTMKSTVMNAFATNQGIIFVNLGLLAKIKNESELAFILAHEITHVEEKHGLNKYLKVQTIKTDKKLYEDLSLDEKLANINHYSRELETEADEKGLKRYLKAGYSLDAIEGAFTALSYSRHPFIEHEIDFKWLESSTFNLPKEFVREKINAITPEEDDHDEKSDSTSTHPSIHKRKASILDKIKDVSPDGRKVYQVSEADFASARKFAQFEVCRLHMVRQMYHLAIYEALGLMKEYPQNLYLQKVVLKSMAALAYIANGGINMREWEKYVNKDLQGNIQRTHHFFLSLATNVDYLGTIAARYGWLLRKQHPQDKEIEAVSDSLLKFVFVERNINPEFFSKTPRTQSEADSVALAYLPKDSIKHYTVNDSVVAEGDPSYLKSIARTADFVVRNDTTAPNNEAPIEIAEVQGDTVVYTSLEEAKRAKIKLNGYQRNLLKNKEKYDVKGVKKDGTIVYNPRVPTEPEKNTTPRPAKPRKDIESQDTIIATDTALVETVYFHNFIEPIDGNFHKYAFVDFADDAAFFKKADQHYKDKRRADDKVSSPRELQKQKREQKLNYARGYALNISKVVMVNPQYRKVNLANPDKQQYLASEKNQKRFSNLLKINAKISGIKYQIVDNKELKNKDVATFNDVAFLNEWLNERLELGDNVPFSTLELAEREALAKKYGTRYFMWTGNISVKEKDHGRTKRIVWSVICPPIMPFLLPSLVRGGKYQVYYYIVVDVLSNEVVLADVVSSNQAERNDFLHSQIYYTFNQLNYKR